MLEAVGPGAYDVMLALVNLLQTCFLAYLAFRARPGGELEGSTRSSSSENEDLTGPS